MTTATHPEFGRADDCIRFFDAALPPRDCRRIIERFESDETNHYAGTVSGMSGDTIKANLKQSRELRTQSPGWEDLDDLLYQNLSWHIDRYLRELGSACQLPGRGLSDQPYRIKRYDVGQGFDWHIDNGSTETANRVIAAQWYLNDVEEGGETEFKLSGRRIRCVEGRLLFFPVQWTLVHRGRPPRSSPKYIATTFFTPRF